MLWLSEGKRDREIATILGLSPRTVEKHVCHILEKLQVETRTAAVNEWHRSLHPAPPALHETGRSILPDEEDEKHPTRNRKASLR